MERFLKLITLTVITTLSASPIHAKGLTLKLAGEFEQMTFEGGIVSFVFTGKLLDSSHPDAHTGFPLWDYPIAVKDLKVTSRDAICMDHRNRRNFSFVSEDEKARACMARIEDLVAAVGMESIQFTGDEVKSLVVEGLHFYGMEQVSP